MCLFCWTQRKIFWRMWDTAAVFFSPTMEVNGAPKQPDYALSLKYLPLCSEQTHSYRCGNTWGWVNDDRIKIFGWNVPLIHRSNTNMWFISQLFTFTDRLWIFICKLGCIWQFKRNKHERELSLVLTYSVTAAFCARASDVCAFRKPYSISEV